MPGGLLGALGALFRQRQAQAPKIEDARSASSSAGAGSLAGQGAQWPQAADGSSQVAEFNDPIVAGLNQQLAAENPRIPTEDEQLQQEQHSAWANNDFERCIVIFSRLRELHPDDPNWADKLKVSYFNRGKQYENESNEARAIACYYSALSIDAEFPEAKEAAEQLVEREKAEPSA